MKNEFPNLVAKQLDPPFYKAKADIELMIKFLLGEKKKEKLPTD